MPVFMNFWRALRSIPGAAIFLWAAARGYRVRPWRSPYLRWRVETYTGIPAQQITVRDVTGLISREWAQMARFLQWVEDMRRKSGKRP